MWTRFMDMHSGGPLKTNFEDIYIEAAESEAMEVFREHFHMDPLEIGCECCGENYSVSEHETIESATQSARTRFRGPIVPLNDYISGPLCLLIYEETF